MVVRPSRRCSGAQFDLHAFAKSLVQRTQRLVEQQHRGLDDQRTAKGDALLLSAGELGGIALSEAGELDEVERVGDALDGIRLGDPAHLEAERNILLDGEMREQRVVLKQHPDVAAMDGNVGHPRVVHIHIAGGRPDQACDHAKAGGLAAPARTEQGDQIARLDRQ